MQKALDIAKYILSLSDEDAGDIVSNLKLQKLLYYSQGFSLAANGRPLFTDDLCAWKHGPVCPAVYTEYKGYGSGAIPAASDFDCVGISEEDRSLIDEVYNVYGQYSAWKLRDMTHEEAPWVTAYQAGVGTVIDHESLSRYFKTLVN